MGQNSSISWTDHTFSPWWGCEKVSPACAHCYAETWAKRWGHSVWGNRSPRRFFGDRHWREPKRWNRQAIKDGVRRRVFCSSMADVFEDRPDLDEPRARLMDLITETSWLDWLLLTKRPENMIRMLGREPWMFNVWAGTTAENDEWWRRRVPHLLQVPVRIKFVSVEPMLGPITESLTGIDWILVGGESGPGARRMDPQWAGDLLRRCRDSEVYYHFKQKGEALARERGCASRTGGDPTEWPEELRVQEFPSLSI